MSEEKRKLGDYEIIQSIYIGDKEVVFGVDKKRPVSLYGVLLRLPQPSVSSVADRGCGFRRLSGSNADFC